jgi:hypothetical protein
MRKRVSILFASTMTVVGLAAGVTPAQAAPIPEANSGVAYIRQNFGGEPKTLQSQARCELIGLPDREPARSVANTSVSSTITLYASYLFGICSAEVVVLEPGERDTGYIVGTDQLTDLGKSGAIAYSST